jgi:hypothetical protein
MQSLMQSNMREDGDAHTDTHTDMKSSEIRLSLSSTLEREQQRVQTST